MADKPKNSDDIEMFKHLDLLMTFDPANVDFNDVVQDLDVLADEEAPGEDQ